MRHPGEGDAGIRRLAYSDGRCYGMKRPPAETGRPARSAATLQPQEIEAVVGLPVEKVVGKGPMDRAKCIEYWGSEVEACKDLK